MCRNYSVSPLDFFKDGDAIINNALYFYVIKDDANNVIEKQLGQFYYFIDARLKNIGKVYGDETLSVFNDYTGFYQYRYNPKSYEQKYLRIDILPSIYYDRDKNDICWKFNGNETGISAIGIEGKSGKDADLSIVLVEAGTDDYSAEVKAEFNYLQKDNTANYGIYWDYEVSKIKEGKSIICCKTTLGDNESYNFAYGELIKSDDGVLNAYWNPGTMFSHVINDMKITSYFYDMGENTIPTAPHYLAIPSDFNRITGNNKNAAHVIRNVGTNSGSIGDLEFVNTSNAFNTTESQNPRPERISEIRDIKISNYNLKVGEEKNVYISNDKVKVGSTSYIGSTGSVINGNLDVIGSGTFNEKITGKKDADISGSIDIGGDAIITGLTTMKGGAVGKVNEIDDVYLGCPIGIVVMWVGQTAPKGWFLCNGDRILIKNSVPVNQKIQDISFKEGELQKIVDVLSGEFGAYAIINIHRTNEYIAEATIEGDTITISALTSDINLARKFYLNNETAYTIQDKQGNVFTNSEYTKYTVRELPDLQQKFPLGAKNNYIISSDPNGNGYKTDLGNTGGEDKHILTENEMPQHMHNMNSSTNIAGSGTYAVDYGKNGGELKDFTTKTTGENDPHNNIPPFLAINFIIKYK